MPDESQRWSRALSMPSEKGPFQAQHATGEHEIKEINPHQQEALRERQYLIWISVIVFLTLTAGLLVWLLLR